MKIEKKKHLAPGGIIKNVLVAIFVVVTVFWLVILTDRLYIFQKTIERNNKSNDRLIKLIEDRKEPNEPRP